jgi:putative OPT family oligopeptide transporter
VSLEKKGLREEAYKVIAGEEYPPYVSPGDALREFSLRAVVLGILIGVLFGAANAYLGLKVGITVCASIPAAVMAVAVFRLIGGATVLENNIVQTVGSAGESLAAGVIFTIPALLLLGFEPGVLKIFIIGLIGGWLGVLLMIPLRRFLVFREHGRLPYPEGTACAEVLVAGDEGGTRARPVFLGLGLAGVYEFLMSGLGLWESTPRWNIPRYSGGQISGDASPALLGVGFVIGPRIAGIIFSGGALAWLVLIPLITLVGRGLDEPVYPASLLIRDMSPHDVWHFYIRYIGAGAVAFGGLVTLIRALPAVLGSLRAGLKALKKSSAGQRALKRTDRDLPMSLVWAGVILAVFLIWLLPGRIIEANLVVALLMVIFAFFFVTVSSRIVGLIGSSSNPVSGMTIATLLGTSLIFVALGWTSREHQAAALAVGAVVCIAAAIAGDTSQDLKTGFLVGATPRSQQIGEFIGVLTSAIVIGWVVLRLHQGIGIGSEELPAPQATLMSLVVKGVLTQKLPWGLVLIGVFLAALVEVIGVPSLPFAVGVYLPLSLTTPILIGGGIRTIVERRSSQASLKERRERGVLYASGMIAGSAFVGMGLGLVKSSASLKWLVDRMYIGGSIPEWIRTGVAILLFLLLAVSLMKISSLKNRDTD